jgi:putative ABC transport system permease protein
MASDKFRYKPGQSYQLADFKGVTIRFIGTFSTKNSAYQNVVLVGRNYVEEMDGAIGEASQIYVAVDTVENSRKTQDAINALVLPFPHETMDQKFYLAAAKSELQDVIKFQRFVMVVSIIVILVGVANTISMATRDRVREIGVLRSVGFERGKILGIVLTEAMLVAFIGGIIGAASATGYLYVGNISDDYMMLSVPMRVSSTVFVIAAVLPICLGVLGGFPSAFSASRLPIVNALRSAE